MAEQSESTGKPTTRQLNIRVPDGTPVFYANYFSITATKGDLRLRFGQVEEADSEKLSANVVATVFVAPEHLLDFYLLMSKKLEEYPTLFPNSAWSRLADAKTSAE